MFARFLATLVLAIAATPAAAEPPMWVVRDADSELVLFGSVHVLPPGLAWRPAALEAALAKAQDVWFELPVDAESEALSARLAAERGLLPAGGRLSDLLSPLGRTRLAAAAERLRLSPDLLERMEPWLAEVALAGALYRQAGASAEEGVEKQLAAAVPAAAKLALETPAEQIAFFDEAPLDEQVASLEKTLEEVETDPQAFDRLVRLWLAADLAGLQRLAMDPLKAAAPGLFQRVVVERNGAWTRRIEQRLKGRGRTVVVVGVGHLIGEEGLPARLRALGYSVEGP